MKNRKRLLTYALLLLVLGIWGLLGYRMWDYVYEVPSTDTMKPILDIPKETTVSILDTFIPQPFYRNPFGKQKRNSRPLKPEKSKKVSVVPKPKLMYTGHVEGGNRLTAFVRFNGKDYITSEGDRIEEIQVLRISADHLRIRYKNRVFIYPLEK